MLRQAKIIYSNNSDYKYDIINCVIILKIKQYTKHKLFALIQTLSN